MNTAISMACGRHKKTACNTIKDRAATAARSFSAFSENAFDAAFYYKECCGVPQRLHIHSRQPLVQPCIRAFIRSSKSSCARFFSRNTAMISARNCSIPICSFVQKRLMVQSSKPI